MTTQELLERKVFYENKRVELAEYSYEEEKAIELEKAKAEIEQKYEQIKQADIQKVDHYIELLNVLVHDSAAQQFVDDGVASTDC